MPKKATFRDLARLAEVSPSTVSRIASGSTRVDAGIRGRVRAVAAQLGIDLAKTAKNQIVVFLLGNRDVLHGFQARILVGAEEYCTSRGWELVFLSFHHSGSIEPDTHNLPQILRAENTARGVILGGTNPANFLIALRERGVPFSVLGNNVIGDWTPNQYDVVSSDDVRGSHEITSHLISQGHRDIWYIGDVRFPWFARCFEGYEKAMTDAGLAPRRSEIRSDRQELGYLSAKSIIASGEPVTAIFAGTDQVAHGVYRALRAFDIRIPEDISVVGFNDTEGSILHPGLTTTREFPEELGRHLAELVTSRVANPDLPTRQICIPTELVRRESVRRLAPIETQDIPAELIKPNVLRT